MSFFSISPFKPASGLNPIQSITPFQPQAQLTGNLLFQNINKSLLGNIGSTPKISLADTWRLQSLDLDPRRLKAEELFLIQPSPEQLKMGSSVATEVDTGFGLELDSNLSKLPTSETNKFVNPNLQLRHNKHQPLPTKQTKSKGNAPQYQQWEERKFAPEKEGFFEKLSKLFKQLAP